MSRSVPHSLLFTAVLVAGLSGCVSNKPGSTSTAHKVMPFATPEAIHDALVEVFLAEDYNLEQDGENRLVFSRAATQRDEVLFGSFLSGVMSIDVEIEIVPRNNGTHLVTLNAFVIKDGDTDRKIGLIGSRHYKSLLGRAEANLVGSKEK